MHSESPPLRRGCGPALIHKLWIGASVSVFGADTLNTFWLDRLVMALVDQRAQETCLMLSDAEQGFCIAR